MGSESGGKTGAIAYILIKTAKLNGIDPQAWLTDVLGRIPSTRSPVSTSRCAGPTLNADGHTSDPRIIPVGFGRTLTVYRERSLIFWAQFSDI